MKALRQLRVKRHAWPLREPFVISRGARTEAHVIVVELAGDGHVGYGEAGGVGYHGETPETMQAQVESIREAVENGCGRRDLPSLLPAGGARHALDAALWDLEAKREGMPVWKMAGAGRWEPVASTVTIGIRSLDAYERSAREYSEFPWLKVKVDDDSPVEAIAAVRRGAPRPRLIVDANQSWSVAALRQHAERLRDYGVDLLEQPVPAGEDAGLAEYRCPIPLCADESMSTAGDLPSLVGRYEFVNIKLDKVGGLTPALHLAEEARRLGLRLMVGCMLGGSVSVAPAMVLAQQCEVCDLDGPWLLARDWLGGIVYNHGIMQPPAPQLWG